MRSLSLKLSLLFVVITLVSVSIISLWVNHSVKTEFSGYCQRCYGVQAIPGPGQEDLLPGHIGPRSGGGMTAAEQLFLDAFNNSLWLATIVALVAAVILATVFSRFIAHPMRQLALSAKKIASGDFSQRVPERSRDEVGELSAAFNSMAGQLNKKEQGRRRLLADIAHELRTPLTIIQGNLEAWLDGIIEPGPEQIASVYDETVLLSRLVTDLKDLSMAEAGELKLHQSSVELADLINAETSSVKNRFDEKGVSLQAELPPGLPAVYVDSDRIRQVLHNLLDNAFRHTDAGGSVRIAAVPTLSDRITVSIADTGAGISPGDLPHVFDHFYKADHSRQRMHGGAGIGLAVVKQLIEAHGGRVWAESQVGQGSSFYFTVPTAPAPQ